MKAHEKIRQAIKQIAHQDDALCLATIQSVNESEGTCTVICDDGLKLEGVRLRVSIDDKTAFVVVPVVDSMVLVAQNNDDFFIVMQSEVQSLQYTIKKTALIFKEKNFELKHDNDATFSVTEKGFSVKTASEDLKKVLSDLLDAVGAITVPTGTGPSGIPVNKPQIDQIKTRLDKLFI
ncbi:MAG: hypothetical protein K2Q03_03545 [Sphingobacteriaceae bacterium]|nr:hypothetical protein [Sphingobacteriaceae bacterium]